MQVTLQTVLTSSFSAILEHLCYLNFRKSKVNIDIIYTPCYEIKHNVDQQQNN